MAPRILEVGKEFGMNGNSTDISDVEFIDGFTDYGYDNSFQFPSLSDDLALPHAGFIASQTFNIHRAHSVNPYIADLDDFAGVAVPTLVTLGQSPLAASTPLHSPLSASAPAPAATPNINFGPQARRFRCTICPKVFTRPGDLRRHIASKHQAAQEAHVYPVMGCPKSHGNVYSRADKPTEYMWRKHTDLGYMKAV